MRAARTLLLLLVVNLLLAGLIWWVWRDLRTARPSEGAADPAPAAATPQPPDVIPTRPAVVPVPGPTAPPAPAPANPTKPSEPVPAPPPPPVRPTQPEPPAPARGGHAYAGLPRAAGYPNPLSVLVNRAYTVGYDETRRNPAWSSYRLPAEALPQRFPRPSRFRADGRTRAQVRHEDYSGSGYDRGHLTPNHAIATRFGATAQEETFLMTNIIPQAPDLNQGPWRELEATLAERTAVAAREIWVTVGPAYRGATRRLASGSAVPSDCWMVVADETPRGPRLQAFLMSQSTPRSADYRRFVTSVDAVERAAQLDLFHELPDATENRLESETPACWVDGG